MPETPLIKTIADITKSHLEKFCRINGYILDLCEMRNGLVYFKIKFKIQKSENKKKSLMSGEYVTIEKEEEIKNINISVIQKIINNIQIEISKK
jgi:hypothetical protein